MKNFAKLTIIVTALMLSSFSPKRDVPDGSAIIFWTSNNTYGQIQIFVNNTYRGNITASYASAPQCAAQGCVTVVVTGTNNTWRAQTQDGKRKWTSQAFTMRNQSCTSMRLQ